MATYGKKKRAMFPGFPVFPYTQLGVEEQADKPETKRQILGPKTTNGKSVIATARHALATRFGSPSTKYRTLSGVEHEFAGQARGNTSFQASHLPAYESMRARKQTPEPPADDENPFSDEISGLRQHPTNEWFSSSPIGFSTPRVRLEPVSDAMGKRHLSTVLVPNPSLPDFDFEQDMTDDETDPLIHDWSAPGCGFGAKRKNTTEDPAGYASKHAKRGLVFCRETKVTARSSGQLGNNPLPVQNAKKGERDKSEEDGFAIFGSGKDQNAENRIRTSAASSSNKPHSRQRPLSMSTSSSVLFSSESRARVPLVEEDDEDEMDIDELQMDDIEILNESMK
ncbi:MAG: hypothetical protein Q9218_000816 [Villophora microphyllina]